MMKRLLGRSGRTEPTSPATAAIEMGARREGTTVLVSVTNRSRLALADLTVALLLRPPSLDRPTRLERRFEALPPGAAATIEVPVDLPGKYGIWWSARMLHDGRQRALSGSLAVD